MRRVEPPAQLLRFETSDGLDLYGLLFEPERKTKRVAVFLHGTGGGNIFESKRTNALAKILTDAGIAYFPFNNRGAHLMKHLRLRRGTRVRRIKGGMAFERIRDCVFDIDGALRELRRRGYRDITLIGHSTGANKIALYDHYAKRNLATRYVLFAGGDDVGLVYQPLGARRFQAALAKAKLIIRAKRGEELVPSSLSALPMSWFSFYDMANPDGDYNVFPFLEVMRGLRLSRRPRFRFLKSIRKPTLAVYGDKDEYCFGDVSRCVAILADAVANQPNFEIVTVADADHGFGGKEKELGELIAGWIGSS
jgi:pimeloyl-ACP methyl ester carboxylesterase